MHIRQPEIAAVEAVGQFLVVESELIENRRVEIVHVDLVLHGPETKLVGRPMGRTGLESPAREPGRETLRIVVPSRAVALGVRRATELPAKPDDGVVEKSALPEIFEQSRHRPIHREGMIGVFGEIRMLVPRRIGGVVAVGHLHKADAGLAKPASEEAFPSEILGRGPVSDAVEVQSRRILFREIGDLRGVALEPPGEFVGFDRCLELVSAKNTYVN